MRHLTLLLLCACSSGSNRVHLVGESESPPSVGIAIIDAPSQLVRNQTSAIRVGITRTNVTGPVQFALLDPPTGLSLEGTADADATDVSISLHADATAELGAHTLSVLATLDSLASAAQISLSVYATPVDVPAGEGEAMSLTYATSSGVFMTGQAVTGIAPTVSHATPPITYDVVPSLPSGLTLNSGAVTGSATAVTAEATYTITATDAANHAATATVTLTITQGCDNTCVPLPSGWLGPVRMESVGTPCAGDYATTDKEVYDSVSGIAYTCECSCTLGPQYWQVYLGIGSCTDNGYYSSASSAFSCTTFGGNFGPYLTPTITSVTCTSDNHVVSTGSTNYTGSRSLCTSTATTPVGCAQNEVCAPADGPLCVYQLGNAAATCPAAYPNRSLRYNGTTDSRSCTGCSAGCPGGLTQANITGVTAYTNTSCTSGATSLSYNTCYSDGTPIKALRMTGTAASCTKESAAQATGSVTAGTPTVVCCAD